jgi:hypothetical protein
MAVAATVHSTGKLGGDTNLELKIGTISIAGDASWLAAGEAITGLGWDRTERLIITGGSGAANAYSWEWDSANQVLKAYRTDQVDDPAEAVPDTTDLSALTALEFLAVGQ